MTTPVYLEIGSSRTFACSLEWPGWSRSAKEEDAALEALAAYADRYRPVAEVAGVRFGRPERTGFEVVERLPGDATTNFGAPGTPATADGTALTSAQARRLAALVAAAWTVSEQVAERAPAELRKGPRGGGRDRERWLPMWPKRRPPTSARWG